MKQVCFYIQHINFEATRNDLNEGSHLRIILITYIWFRFRCFSSLFLSVSLSHKSWFFFVFLHMRSFKTKQQQKHEHIFWHIFLVVQEAVVGVNHISNFFGTILNGLQSFKSYFFVSQMKLFLKSIFIVVICKAMCELIESIRWFYCHSSCYYCC